MLLLEIFLCGVEVGNKYSLGFLYLCKKEGLSSKPSRNQGTKMGRVQSKDDVKGNTQGTLASQ